MNRPGISSGYRIMHKIRVNPLALKDLKGIKSYISDELANPEAAVRIIREIVETYEKLRDFPEMGPSLDTSIDIPTDYRYVDAKDHYIFYKVEGEYVSIYRVLNARMDFLRVLFRD